MMKDILLFFCKGLVKEWQSSGGGVEIVDFRGPIGSSTPWWGAQAGMEANRRGLPLPPPT